MDKAAVKPNLELTLGSAGKNSHQAGVAAVGRDPRFNQTFVFPAVTVTEDAYDAVWLELKNGTRGLGSLSISLENCVLCVVPAPS